MKRILVVASLLTLTACSPDMEKELTLIPKEIPKTVEIEGHDYFEQRTCGSYYVYSHKGNCHACDHPIKTNPQR